MLLQESKWYRDSIHKHIIPGSLVLNIGSSTKHFVEVQQPYIKVNVLDELSKKNCIIKNIDIKKSDGVDIVGDISDPSFVVELRTLKPDAVICANVHEHIESRSAFSKGLESLIDDRMILLVSAPYRFPYHKDPIDTMYRVNVKGLMKDFPNLELVEGKVIAGDYYFSMISQKLSTVGKVWFFIKRIIKFILLMLTFQYKEAAEVGWSFRRVYETCVVCTRHSKV